MKTHDRLVAFAVCLALSFFGSAWAEFVEDFSGGLDLWTTEGLLTPGGDVNETGGVAVLADATDYGSALYRGVALTPGNYILEFDVQNGLSSNLNDYFPDTFYASLYFINVMADFDLTNLVFGDARPLFSMDTTAPDSFFDVFADLSPSGLGADWTHVRYAFTNAYQYVIPTFELFDFNSVAGDSSVGIDNVSITSATPTPVPEPATIVIVGTGMAGLAFLRRKRSC